MDSKFQEYTLSEKVVVGRPTRQRVYPHVLFHIAHKNLTHKKLRTTLTIFGIVIGIGAISFLLSFGLGLQKLVTDQVIGEESIKTIDMTTPNSRIIKLDASARNKVRTFPNVQEVGVQYEFPGIVSIGGGEIDVASYGLDTSFQKLAQLTALKGRLLKNDDIQSVVISKAALEAIGKRDLDEAIGSQVTVTIPLQTFQAKQPQIRSDFEVVGIIDAGSNREIFLPSSTLDLAGVPSYKQIKVVADSTDNIPEIRKQIESLGFQTTSPVDTLEQINQLFRVFNIILTGFGAIGIIVAVLGMFNTLTIALLERTKEIGLMVTLGGRSKDMLRLFLIEALLLSGIGALVGIGLSMLGGGMVNIVMNRNSTANGGESYDLFSTPSWLVVCLTAFMMLIGLIVVYLPARRAQKIDPIDALRRE